MSKQFESWITSAKAVEIAGEYKSDESATVFSLHQKHGVSTARVSAAIKSRGLEEPRLRISRLKREEADRRALAIVGDRDSFRELWYNRLINSKDIQKRFGTNGQTISRAAKLFGFQVPRPRHVTSERTVRRALRETAKKRQRKKQNLVFGFTPSQIETIAGTSMVEEWSDLAAQWGVAQSRIRKAWLATKHGG